MPEQHNFAMYTIDSRCNNVLQATCRHVQCLMLTCNNKKVLPFATPKRYGKIAVGLCDKCRGSLQATCRHLYNVLNAAR
ncbi:unknown [Corallococcus sp. CAG:1435]|nr:unknown [Corallococcus sp. CAG:1435]